MPNPAALAQLDDDRLTLAGLLFEATSGLAHVLEQGLRDDADLTPPWFEVLLRLARSPERQLRMSDLAAQTALTRSGLTRLIDRLEEEGLVARRSCPTDRRGQLAQLTAAGLDRVLAAIPGHLALLEEHLVDVLGPADRARLEAILRTLRAHLHPTGDQRA